MAASNIVLADAQATPVNHTFFPKGPRPDGTFEFEDQSATAAIGFWKVTYKLQNPASARAGDSSAKRTYRAIIGLHEPVLETVSNNTVSGISPAPTVSYVPRCFIEFVMPERTALVDRKSLRKMAYNLLNESQLIAMVENLTMPY